MAESETAPAIEEKKPAGPRRSQKLVIAGLLVFAVVLIGVWFAIGPNSRFIADSGDGEKMTPFPVARDGGAPPSAELIRRRAEASEGEAKAQHELALLYLEGADVARDEKEAALWFRKAALQGFAGAQFQLAMLYQAGRGVPGDDKQALSWYRRAAEQNHTRAQHSLATFYAEGRGTPKNLKLARRWYREAAAAGSTEAADRLNSLARENSATAALDDAPARPLARKGVAEIQRLLHSLNFAPGPADGHTGERTTAAIRMYQQFADLPVDGVPGARLLDDLRKVVAEMKRGAGDKPR